MKKRRLPASPWLVVAIVSYGVASGAQGCARPSPSHQTHQATQALAAATTLARGDATLSALLVADEGAFQRDRDTLAALDTRAFVSAGWRATESKQFDALGARAPTHADGLLDVGVSRFEAWRLSVRLVNAQHAPAVLDRGRVVYPDAMLATDRIVASSRYSLEEALLLRDERAPRQFAWNIHVPAGVAGVVSSTRGLDFRDALDRTALRIVAPYGRDARGEHRALAFAWNDATRALDVSLGDWKPTYPVLVDPRFETWVWRPQTLLTQRTHVAMSYDADREHTLLFGGFAGGVADETWTWDGSSWVKLFGKPAPQARFATAMAYDTVRKRTLLFGGADAKAELLGDTWLWEDVSRSWSKATPTNAPPASSGAMTWNPDTSEVIYFGGSPAQTWAWNGTDWILRSSTGPGPRRGAGMAYDTARKRVVLFGGTTTTAYGCVAVGAATVPLDVQNDTWEWDDATWTRVSAGGTGTPSARCGVSMQYVRDVGTIMFGGLLAGSALTNELWRWNGTAWSALSTPNPPSPRVGAGGAYDAKRDRVVLFGGYDGGPTLDSNETWEWQPARGTALAAWALRPVSEGPSIRWGASGASHGTKHVVMNGGRVYPPEVGPAKETWVWNGASWQLVATNGPDNAAQASMAYDEARNETIYYVGGATWRWSGTAWSLVATTSPPQRAAHALAYDAKNQRVVLTGGYQSDYLAETWTWNGATWKLERPAHEFGKLGEHATAYDRKRERVVLFGGVGPLAETWTWDGGDWTQQKPTASPPARYRHGMAYDTKNQLTILYGGSTSTSTLGDTWLWDGTTWSPLGFAESPAAREASVFVYDEAHQKALLFSGATDAGSLNDTWTLERLGATCTSDLSCSDGSFCVDGVCCNQRACGTCEQCDGVNPGRCTAVQNAADPDTCDSSGTRMCSALAECKAALGIPAIAPAECASGFVVDGVCCNSACDAPCRACSADRKALGTLPGVCDLAKSTPDRACSVATCIDEHTVQSPMGQTFDCDSYRCEGSMCRTTCSSAKDCYGSALCDVDHHCVRWNDVPSDGPACSVH